MPGNKRFLFAGEDKTLNDVSSDGHGTYMVLKITGPLYDTAKKAKRRHGQDIS
jgi:hypothetical protein